MSTARVILISSVEFEPGQVVGLLHMAGLERELSDILGRKVNLRTPSDLSRYFRNEVLESAETQYLAMSSIFIEDTSATFYGRYNRN